MVNLKLKVLKEFFNCNLLFKVPRGFFHFVVQCVSFTYPAKFISCLSTRSIFVWAVKFVISRLPLFDHVPEVDCMTKRRWCQRLNSISHGKMSNKRNRVLYSILMKTCTKMTWHQCVVQGCSNSADHVGGISSHRSLVNRSDWEKWVRYVWICPQTSVLQE